MQPLLSSNSLSLKLHSNVSFLGEISTILLSDPLNIQAKHFINDLRVFISLRDLSPIWTRCCPSVTKVVVNLEKFVLPSPSWRFDSGNWIRSWWSLGEVWGWERPSPMWTPQWRRMQPLWLEELREQILCLVCLLWFHYCSCSSLFLLGACPNSRCDS
jgi:hypothetical protein